VAKPVFATNDVPTAAQFNSWLVNVNYARKTSNQSVTSSITLQNDTELFVPVEANSFYKVDALILYDGAAAGDLKFLFRTPTGGSMTAMGQGIVTAGSSQQDNQNLPITGNSSEAVGTFGAGTQMLTVMGLLTVVGTSGNLQLEWSQNTSNATATRVIANSFISLRRMS
jgi:hypothetical protein